MNISQEILSDITIFNKYARYLPEKQRRETWEELVERNLRMHVGKHPDQEEAIRAHYKAVFDKKVLPSMRSVQFAGKAIHVNPSRLFNCLAKETRFVTSEGVRSFEEFSDGDHVRVLSHTGQWQNAVVHSYGEQALQEITFGRGQTIKKVFATQNHRWLLADGTSTTDLQEGDRLVATPAHFLEFEYEDAPPLERLYWAYGFVFGDGSKVKTKHGEYRYSMVRLCGRDARFAERFEELGFKTSSPLSVKGDIFAYTGTYLKTAPDPCQDTPELIRAFVRGYLDADGAKNNDATSPNLFRGIQSSGRDHWEFIELCFEVAGVYLQTRWDLTGQVTNYATRGETYRYSVTNVIGTGPNNAFKVKSIKPSGRVETVWCLEVEEDRSFVLSGGIVTGNCSYVPVDDYRVFSEIMFLLLGGVGVGYSVQAHHVEKLPEIRKPVKTRRYVIGDSIEGWAEAIKMLVKAYLGGRSRPLFVFDQIRPKGARLVTAGGKAPGPGPLRACLEQIRRLLDCKVDGEKLTPLECHDVICIMSDAVLAGGIRRAASISLFSIDDQEMMQAKTMYDVESVEEVQQRANGSFSCYVVHRGKGYTLIISERDYEQYKATGKMPWYYFYPWRARANNSVVVVRGLISEKRFMEIWDQAYNSQSGEPGIFLTNNPEWGVNPCSTGETGVYVADGRGVVPIKVLAEAGRDVPVFCLDDGGAVAIRTMRHPRITGHQVPVYRVKLDTEAEVRVTANHKFLLKDGGYREAESLQVGDSLQTITRYEASFEEVLRHSNSRSQDYGWVACNGSVQAEHRHIAQFQYNNRIGDGLVVHHIDCNGLNNNPNNLQVMTTEEHNALHRESMLGDSNPMRRAGTEWSAQKWEDYRQKQREAQSGSRNPNFSGFSHEELRSHARRLTRQVQRRFSAKEWVAYARTHNLPVKFSAWREAHLGGIVGLSKWAALVGGFEVFDGVDLRVVKTYLRLTQEGYDCEITDGAVVVVKRCEHCEEEFRVPWKHREQALCSHKCFGARLWEVDGQRVIRGLREAHEKRKGGVRTLQIEAYLDARSHKGRIPLKKEWVEECRTKQVSAEISRESSPFRSYQALKEAACDYNHRVVSVEFDGYEDVYNGTVDEFHNFFVLGGESVTRSGKSKLSFINNLQCGEVSLRPHSFCNLTTVKVSDVETQEELEKRVRAAAFIGTLQATYTDFYYLRDVWQRNTERDALLGISMTGIAMCKNFEQLDLGRAVEIAKEENRSAARMFGIKEAARIACVKPEGTSSCVLGTTSGIHGGEAPFYIRRIRISKDDPLYLFLQDKHPELVADEIIGSGAVVEIPQRCPEGAILKSESPLDLLRRVRRVYCDWVLPGHNSGHNTHNVSVTVYVSDGEWGAVRKWLWENREFYTGMTVFPHDGGIYVQAPFEPCSEAEYTEKMAHLRKVDLSQLVETEDGTNLQGELACAGGACSLDLRK